MIMSEWFVGKSGKTHGPFSAGQLKQLAAEAKIGPETEVRLGTDGKWVTAKTVKGLFAVQATTAPTVAPAGAPPIVVAMPAQVAALNSSAVGEEELLKVYPSYLRNDPIGFCFLVLLGVVGAVFAAFGNRIVPAQYDPYHASQLAGLGLLLFSVLRFMLSLLRYRKISLVITNRRTTLRYGLFAKFSKEIRHSDIRMLVVRQGFLQRLLGVGGIDVSSAASDESDIKIAGIAHPEKVKELIDSLRP
jgi:membrane protein YdbS with pleckstrin-like domain